jgi:hypothetical protein
MSTTRPGGATGGLAAGDRCARDALSARCFGGLALSPRHLGRYDWRLAKHTGKALADPNLCTTIAFDVQLETHLQLQYPQLKNIRVISATGTGEWDAMTAREWHDVVFLADDSRRRGTDRCGTHIEHTMPPVEIAGPSR